MGSNRLVFAALGLACVAAAAGGGYLATKQNATTLTATAATTPPADAAAPQPVQETEALVAPVELTKPPATPSRDVPQRIASSARTARTNSPAKPPTATPEPPRSWSSTSVPLPTTPEAPTNATSTADTTPASSAHDEELHAPEAPRAPEPAAKTLEELVVSADSVIGLQMETAVSSERAKVEDRVEARVVRDVTVGGAVAIPAGSRAIGSVMTVERGGKLKDRARLGIRFHTLVLADGTRLPITTETLYRSGDAPSNSSAAKIGGGAAAGAILGAIIGGAKGAAIGGSVGAGAGTAVVMNGDRNAATFSAGTDVTARILAPVTVTVEK